jgi:MFS family permease
MSGDPSPRKILGFDRNVFFAGVVSFFMDFSSEMIYPLVPLFLSSVLGVDKAVIGLIEGIAETTASTVKLGSGWLADRFRRRKLLMGLGYGVSAASRPLLALSGSWGQVLGARFIDRFGKGVRTAPRDAIVADASSARRLGRNFGFHRAMDQFGAVVGPAIAFLILRATPGAYRTVFWISIIPAIIAVLVIVFFIQERRPPGPARVPPTLDGGGGGIGGPGGAGRPGPEPDAGAPGVATASADRPGPAPAAGRAKRGWWARLHDLRGPLLGYMVVTGLFSLGNSADAFLILRAQNLGVALVLIPLLYLAFNLVYSGLSLPAGLVADRIGRKRVAVIGYLLFACAYGGLALAKGPEAVWLLFLLYGVYMGVADGNGRALLAELAPPDRRGTAFGAYHGVVGLAALPASVIAGLLWDRVSPAAPFVVGAIGALLAAALLPLVVREPARR